jgi:hypothetical protein
MATTMLAAATSEVAARSVRPDMEPPDPDAVKVLAAV